VIVANVYLRHTKQVLSYIFKNNNGEDASVDSRFVKNKFQMRDSMHACSLRVSILIVTYARNRIAVNVSYCNVIFNTGFCQTADLPSAIWVNNRDN
jgi:hypothetical protein